jgi:hypothetical protein
VSQCSLLLGGILLGGGSILLGGGSGLSFILLGGSSGLGLLSRGSLSSILLGSSGGLALLGGCGLGLFLGGSNDATELLELLGNTLVLAGGVLGTTSLTLLSELLLTDLLLLHLVDGLDQDSLILELVTLGAEVELMVEILGDLLGIAILAEEATEDSLASHPQNLLGHTGISGTLSLTVTTVAALASGLVEGLDAGAGVHVDLTSHDETILEQLADVLSGVGEGNLSDFIGVDPNSLEADLEDGGGESLLKLQGRHI